MTASRNLIAALTLIGVSCAYHLRRLPRPLADIDACAGPFFGVFFNYYDEFGFAELRGMPLWPVLYPVTEAAQPYLTHPPGLWWMMYALGGDEAAMRWPTIVGATLAALALYGLLRPRLGAGPAWIAGALLLGAPAMAVYCQLSYEPVSTGIGLSMLWAARRAMQTERWPWDLLVGVCAFVGTWMDWSFGMYCFALVPWVAARSWRTTLRRLAVPAGAAVLAAASVLAWQKWALSLERIIAPESAGSAWETIERTIGARPPLGLYLQKIGHWLYHSMGPALLVGALLGLWMAWRRAPRLILTLAVAGASHFLLFAEHALGHPHFYCLSTPWFCAAAAGLAWVAVRHPRPPTAVIAAIATVGVVLGTWWSGVALDRRTHSNFMRDFGAELCAAAADDHGVLTNFFPNYAYYVDDSTVYPIPIVDPALIEGAREKKALRYLWCEVEKAPGLAHNDRLPHLELYLSRFERRRIAKLEHHLFDPGYRWDYRIVGAWLYELPKAE